MGEKTGEAADVEGGVVVDAGGDGAGAQQEAAPVPVATEDAPAQA